MSDPTTFLGKSKDDIRKEIMEIGKRETGISNLKSTGVLRGILETMSLMVTRIYTAFLTPMLTQVDRRKATGFWLDLHGNNLGVVRNQAKRTTGTFTGTAYKAGTLKAGAWIRVEGTKLRFRVTKDVPFLAGPFKVPVEAERTGPEYNVTSKSRLVLTKVTMGVESVSAGKDWIGHSGTNTEEDAAYRRRIDARWNIKGDGNPPSRYVLVARSAAGITHAKVLRTPRGWGSVDVIVAGSAGLPTPKQLADVRAALEGESMICRDLVVRAPEKVTTDIVIEFSGKYTAAQVENAVRNWVAGLGIGKNMEIRQLYRDPWDGWTFSEFEVLQPNRDIKVGKDAIVVPTIKVRKV